MKDKFNILFSNTLIFAIGNVLTKFLMFFLMPLYTTVLSREQYATAELINNTIQLLLPIFTISIAEGLFRFCIDEKYDKSKLLTNSISIILKSNIIITLLMIFCKYIFNYEYWFVFIILFMSTSTRNLFAQFVRGIGYSKIFAISGIINALALVALNIIFLNLFKMRIYGYLVSIILSNIISSIYLISRCRLYKYVKKQNTDKYLLKDMIKYSLPNAPNMVSWWVTNMSSRYIILYFLGPVVAGVFTAASKLPSLVNLLSTIFQQAWQFSAAKEYGKDDSKEFYSQVFQYYSATIILSSSILILASELIARFILKGEFYEGWVYVPCLLASATLGCYSTFFGTFYNAAKNNFMAMVSTFIGAGITLVGCIYLIPVIGVKGALYANILGYLVIVIVRVLDISKIIDINIKYIRLIMNVTIIIFQATCIMNNNTLYNMIAYIMFILLMIINIKELKGIFSIVINIKKQGKRI